MSTTGALIAGLVLLIVMMFVAAVTIAAELVCQYEEDRRRQIAAEQARIQSDARRLAGQLRLQAYVVQREMLRNLTGRRQ